MTMVKTIDLDLASHKISIHIKTPPLVIAFDTPARKFYFSLIALMVHEMKIRGEPGFVYVRKHEKMLWELDNSISGKFTSKNIDSMWAKIRMAWRQRLPDLETASLFKIENRDLVQPYEKGGKFRYDCSDTECDIWANLFQYDENNIWRFKFAIDAVSLTLEDVHLCLGDLRDRFAWQAYVDQLEPQPVESKAPVEKQSVRCPACGLENSPVNLFCSACGRNLKAPDMNHRSFPDEAVPRSPILNIPKVPVDPDWVAGERKLITVLCAELIDFTQLTEMHDPEEVHQLMSFLFNVFHERIQGYNGMINQFAENGVMALFGAPTAQEDHARQACYAALAIQKDLAAKAGELHERFGVKLSLRIGLNSGLVVAGTIGGEQQRVYTAVGNTIRVADRIMKWAPPRTVLVSANVYSLVKDYFKFTAFKETETVLKSYGHETYRLIRAGAYDSRIEVASVKGLTKFVGREKTMSRLLDAYENAKAGSSQVILLFGEAGAGKSRVLREFTNRLSQKECIYLEGKCLHHGLSMPYSPVLDILKNYFDIRPQDKEAAIRTKIDSKTSDLKGFDKQYIEFIRVLLSVPSGNSLYQQMDPEQRRKMTFSVIRNLLFSACREKPLMVAVEDFHWIDRISEDFFMHILQYLREKKMLMVFVYRPEYTFQQIGNVDFVPINLAPLTESSSMKLIQAIFENPQIDATLESFIFERSAGNPLIIEEICYNLMEQGAISKEDGCHVLSRSIEEIKLPDTIRGIIAARIDRLDNTLKILIQTASVVGRSFSFDILLKVVETENDLRHQLLLLQRMDFIYEMETIAASAYIFKHALIQEVAYDSLLLKQRKKIHARTSRAIESIHAGDKEKFYGELAYHYEKAEHREDALKYLWQAGESAKVIFANEAAIDFYQRGIDHATVLQKDDKEKQHNWQMVLAQLQEELGDVLALIGQYEKGRASYYIAIDNLFRSDVIGRSRIYRKIGRIWEYQKNHGKVIECYNAAATVLGPKPVVADNAWWQEWIEIRNHRMRLLYWQAQPDEMSRLVEETRPMLEKYGTSVQKAEFFANLTLSDYRLYRYLLPKEHIAYPKAALKAARETHNQVSIGWPLFLLGFSYLWCDQFDLSLSALREALALTEKTGDIVLKTRCLSYLTVVYRRQNRIERVQELIPKCIQVSEKAQLLEYTYIARANLAWVAWRNEKPEETEAYGRDALACYKQVPEGVMPFLWAVLWPLMGAALEKNQVSQSIAYAKQLLDPKQKRLPETLMKILKKAIAYWESGRQEDTYQSLKDSMRLAQEMAYV